MLFLILFLDGVGGSCPGLIGFTLREVTAVLLDPETQWMFFLCLGIYFSVFLVVRFRGASGLSESANLSFWLGSVLVISAVSYAVAYSASIQALILLGGAALGQGTAFWAALERANSKSGMGKRLGVLVVVILVIVLAFSSIWKEGAGRTFEYRTYARWSGPWDSPNIFGLLMGTGIALALGFGSAIWHLQSGISG